VSSDTGNGAKPTAKPGKGPKLRVSTDWTRGEVCDQPLFGKPSLRGSAENIRTSNDGSNTNTNTNSNSNSNTQTNNSNNTDNTSPGPVIRPQQIVDILLRHAIEVTRAGREFMEKFPNKRLPQDFKAYPGKMDHISCVCYRVPTTIAPPPYTIEVTGHLTTDIVDNAPTPPPTDFGDSGSGDSQEEFVEVEV